MGGIPAPRQAFPWTIVSSPVTLYSPFMLRATLAIAAALACGCAGKAPAAAREPAPPVVEEPDELPVGA